MKCSRFNLEERIMRAWATSDDIEDFIYHYAERPERMSEDEVFNVVWGIKEMHDVRMHQLMDVFKRVFELDEYAPIDIQELRKEILNALNKEESND